MSSSSTPFEIARTRTGSFPIGFRRMGSDWQRDLPGLLDWSRDHHFGVIDLGADAVQTAPLLIKAGMRIGSVDLPEWGGMISPDPVTRQKAVEKNKSYIEACAAFGPLNYFVVMLPEKPELPRTENFKYMVESFQQLAPALTTHQARIVIEGWPGPGALCCTPESYGAFFEKCASPVFGVNFDPSHLLRMGIDPMRFLHEFSKRVYHVHGKDTELFPEAAYLYGTEQPPTNGSTHGFGGVHWRYTIPGQGLSTWTEIFKILLQTGYKGAVSVELEDENFNGDSAGEKTGLVHARNFLQSC